MKEDEMVGWHHQLNVHESEQTLAVSEGQRSLAYYSPCVPRVEQNAETNDNVKSVLKFSLRENQSVKKFIYAFEVWCWRRLLRVPWTARRSNLGSSSS